MSTLATRLLGCSKGFCDVAAPLGFTFSVMAGIDELRKIKGYEPIFLLLLADMLIPDTEASKIYSEQRKLTSHLLQNNTINQFYFEEFSLVDKLKDNHILTNEEDTQWKNDISRNESLLTNNTKDIKSKILSNVSKLEEIRKHRK